MHSALKLAGPVRERGRPPSKCGTHCPRLVRAQQLLDWLLGGGEDTISPNEIGKLAPPPFRIKAGAEEAISILKSHGWLENLPPAPASSG